MNWSNHETTKNKFCEIANTMCLLKSLLNEQMYHKSKYSTILHIVSDFPTGIIVKQPKLILVK